LIRNVDVVTFDVTSGRDLSHFFAYRVTEPAESVASQSAQSQRNPIEIETCPSRRVPCQRARRSLIAL